MKVADISPSVSGRLRNVLLSGFLPGTDVSAITFKGFMSVKGAGTKTLEEFMLLYKKNAPIHSSFWKEYELAKVKHDVVAFVDGTPVKMCDIEFLCIKCGRRFVPSSWRAHLGRTSPCDTGYLE